MKQKGFCFPVCLSDTISTFSTTPSSENRFLMSSSVSVSFTPPTNSFLVDSEDSDCPSACNAIYICDFFVFLHVVIEQIRHFNKGHAILNTSPYCWKKRSGKPASMICKLLCFPLARDIPIKLYIDLLLGTQLAFSFIS